MSKTMWKIWFSIVFAPLIIGCALLGCTRQIDPTTGRPVTTLDGLPNQVDRATEACKAGGKTLKSYKDTSSGVEFTCE